MELRIETCEVLGSTEQLPLEVNSDRDYGEEIRLRYRFLDLRRDKVHRNVVLRSGDFQYPPSNDRSGFMEFQT